MKEYVKIYCCGDCSMYDFKTHKPLCGAKNEGEGTDPIYRDCPKGICKESELPDVFPDLVTQIGEALPALITEIAAVLPGIIPDIADKFKETRWPEWHDATRFRPALHKEHGYLISCPILCYCADGSMVVGLYEEDDDRAYWEEQKELRELDVLYWRQLPTPPQLPTTKERERT